MPSKALAQTRLAVKLEPEPGDLIGQLSSIRLWTPSDFQLRAVPGSFQNVCGMQGSNLIVVLLKA